MFIEGEVPGYLGSKLKVTRNQRAGSSSSITRFSYYYLSDAFFLILNLSKRTI